MFTEKQYIKALYQECEDPTQYDGEDNVYVYHCVLCGETECDCEEVWGSVSNCCEKPIKNDRCTYCNDKCISSYQEALDDNLEWYYKAKANADKELAKYKI